MIGTCLCGQVSIDVEAAPEFINACNCKLCRRSGATWGYYMPEAVKVSGETQAFRRDDLGYEAWSDLHFCPTCGSTTHFEVVHPEHKGIGVNTRLFDQADLEGIEVRYYDSRTADRFNPDNRQTATGRIGDGCAF